VKGAVVTIGRAGLALLSVALAACAASPGSPPAVPGASAGALQSPGGCPHPLDGGSCLGPLPAGTYATSTFEVPFTYAVPDGWSNDEDLPGNFLLVPPHGSLDGVNAGACDFIGLYAPTAPAAANCDAGMERGVEGTPEAISSWYAGLPGLDTTEPEAVTLGGLDGVRIDLAIAEGYTLGCPYEGFEGVPMVPLFIGLPPAGVHHVVMSGVTTRLYLLETAEGRTLAVEIADVGSDNLDELTEVVNSIEFAEGTGLTYVALGDSWVESFHCGGCRTFAGLHAKGLEELTGEPVDFVDLAGDRTDDSALLLESLRDDAQIRHAIEDADVVLIATGANEMGSLADELTAGTCGGADQADCIRALGELWASNFDASLEEIIRLRDGSPTAIRLVNAANAFLSVPEMTEGIDVEADFATNRGALIFQVLTDAICDAAAAHGAKCVDVRPLLNGPNLDQPTDENSAANFQAIADALVDTGLPELP
jgi:hypothetical protein